MEHSERLGRRLLFDAIVQTYESGRPTYPEQLFVDLIEFVGIKDRPLKVIEVGPGTGQATRGLLDHGCTVTAIELGENMAARARENLAAYGSQVQVIVGDFERAPMPAESFDLVASASAFHWIDPEIGFAKAAHLLRPAGVMAIWGTGRDPSVESAFFRDVASVYEDLGLNRTREGDPARDDSRALPRSAYDLEKSEYFGELTVRRYESKLEFGRDRYLDYASSYSGFQVMKAAQQQDVRNRIGALIEEMYGGRVTVPVRTTLCLARKRSR